MKVAVRELQTLFEVGSLGGLSDGQLLDRFVERREEAVFEAIVRRHGPMVWGVCRRLLRDHHDAEDAFQTTFLVLARKAASVREREKLGNWLFGVAHQTAMKARVMRARRRGREGQVPDMPEPVVMPDDLRNAVAETLDQELSRLPDKYRIPIVLCELEGMSHKEASEQLGWPIGTVSSRLSRGRSMLARRLSRPGMSLSGGSLAVLLAQESASASMPTRLIGPTARAASLYAASGAATAGAVSAGVATLTKEVMKMMLLSKIKVVTAMLLVSSALAAGGTGLAFQAQTTEPGQKDDLQRLIDEKKEELQRLIDTQKKQGQHTKGTTYIKDKNGKIIAAYTGFRSESGPRPENGPLIDPPSGQEETTEYSPDRLRRQKEYIDAMLEVENARSKPPQDLEEMIRAKTKDLERCRWVVRVVEAQINKFKKIRDGGQRKPPTKREPRPESEPLIDLPSGPEEAAEYSPDQLRRQKEYIDAILEVENSRNKTPEQLDEIVREKTKLLDHFRLWVRVAQAQVNKLKKIRDAGRIDKAPRAK
jgi:RNA polymerase sigma factor (sigma-70 family)